MVHCIFSGYFIVCYLSFYVKMRTYFNYYQNYGWSLILWKIIHFPLFFYGNTVHLQVSKRHKTVAWSGTWNKWITSDFAEKELFPRTPARKWVQMKSPRKEFLHYIYIAWENFRTGYKKGSWLNGITKLW